MLPLCVTNGYVNFSTAIECQFVTAWCKVAPWELITSLSDSVGVSGTLFLFFSFFFFLMTGGGRHGRD